ncbi:unnamed protein product [Cuscuta epithymum]|uniref:Uncharacterized protein n=1 Tax=Cuscuta epithymum TaxID=186058 RepID=A0AAV0CZX0_9ASTE|nr:unnamed protein product [Cuscuta epithymum]
MQRNSDGGDGGSLVADLRTLILSSYWTSLPDPVPRPIGSESETLCYEPVIQTWPIDKLGNLFYGFHYMWLASVFILKIKSIPNGFWLAAYGLGDICTVIINSLQNKLSTCTENY